LAVQDILRPGLIVSCQAWQDSPLLDAKIMAAFALSAERAGAVGIRANSPEHVSAMKDRGVTIPIIGIHKVHYEGAEVYITPTRTEAEGLAAAGADIIAVEGTHRSRPADESLADLIRHIHDTLHRPVMVDISTLEEGMEAARLGADLVATTMSGYTPYTEEVRSKGPDLELVRRLAATITCPVVGEGRFHAPEQVRAALAQGAYAVVVGTALTDLEWRIRQFVPAATEELAHRPKGRCVR